MLDGNNCTVHSVRPLICRIWGATEDMKCKHGCKPEYYLTRQQAEELIRKVYSIEGISHDLWGKRNYERERGIMILTVQERLLLGGVVKAMEVNASTLRNIEAINHAISLSDEENVRWNVRAEGDMAQWNTKDKDKNPIPQEAAIELTPKQQEMIRAELERKSKSNKLNLQFVSLIEKFEVE